MSDDGRTSYIAERITQALDGWIFTPAVDAVLNAPKSRMVLMPSYGPILPECMLLVQHPALIFVVVLALIRCIHQILEDFYRGAGVSKIMLFCQVPNNPCTTLVNFPPALSCNEIYFILLLSILNECTRFLNASWKFVLG